MSDLTNFNSTFFLSLATMTFGFCAGALGYALRSKCSRVKCCCVEIIRDVELEADLEELGTKPINDTSLPIELTHPRRPPISRPISRRSSIHEYISTLPTDEVPQPRRPVSERSNVIEEAIKQAVKRVNSMNELNKQSFISSV